MSLETSCCYSHSLIASSSDSLTVLVFRSFSSFLAFFEIAHVSYVSLKFAIFYVSLKFAISYVSLKFIMLPSNSSIAFFHVIVLCFLEVLLLSNDYDWMNLILEENSKSIQPVRRGDLHWIRTVSLLLNLKKKEEKMVSKKKKIAQKFIQAAVRKDVETREKHRRKNEEKKKRAQVFCYLFHGIFINPIPQ